MPEQRIFLMRWGQTMTSIKSLLRTVLEQSKKDKIKFRYNMQKVEDYGDAPEKRDWGYDIDQVIEDLQTWDLPSHELIVFENGDWISWETWNFGEECLVDLSLGLYDRTKDLRKKWEDDFYALGKGLI